MTVTEKDAFGSYAEKLTNLIKILQRLQTKVQYSF